MAEEVNPNKPAEAAAEVTKTDGMVQGPITIDQFWDENPLIMPWMEQYLPRTRMWKDAIFGAYNCFFSVVVIVLLSQILLLPDKVVFAPGMIFIIWDSYLLAKLNQRMARAQGKFIRAKLNERPFPEGFGSGCRESKNG
ncbi:hypothetical protein [Mesorhizobium sp. WSM3873]|uniref:hypothetical protein n=1 Tax=Mesorhizobium sp. WSM3873 TaxID=1854056 RepID=UPI000801B3DC|nr:hypothetical protein [Mesorhizobium sp. WSM3873]OBQ83552.1 hypothetical protein A9K71_23585 [Mesorhizobium sp. WSM3873]